MKSFIGEEEDFKNSILNFTGSQCREASTGEM